ncbi:hypothetical protein PIB30_020545 [Stylosanthes scabra]|uniref:Uncharacterized protein n=1 Tax=Stylosanthes scabra TaxID=79078 RepID=A0ABU6Z6X6_9FABA|nr:hypothetical protein [Stylosanthes scabra]
MNAVPSECSSGCESGWTLYLEPSFLNHNNNASTFTPFLSQEQNNKDTIKPNSSVRQEEDEDEDNLSMLSDASSGPPPTVAHQTSRKRQKLVVKEKRHHLPSFLDDTASSPLCDFSINNVTSLTLTNQQTSAESMVELDSANTIAVANSFFITSCSSANTTARENKNESFLANSLYRK